MRRRPSHRTEQSSQRQWEVLPACRPGSGFDETVGLDGAAPVLDALAAGELKDHSIHAVGATCSRCGGTFTEDTPVRRNTNHEWVHDVCPD